MSGRFDNPRGDRDRRRLRAALIRRQCRLRCAGEPREGVLGQPGGAAGVREQVVPGHASTISDRICQPDWSMLPFTCTNDADQGLQWSRERGVEANFGECSHT